MKFKVIAIQTAYLANGEEHTDEIVLETFNNLARAVQYIENNSVSLIEQGWEFKNHISRNSNPGEVCDFKEWQKDMMDTHIELFHTIEPTKE
jgi:hypothetical protein